jgi:hypothetical protein
MLNREFDVRHDIVGDFSDTQPVFKHQIQIDSDMVVGEVYLNATTVVFGREQLDADYTGVPGSDADYSVRLGYGASGDGSDGARCDLDLAMR